MSSRRLDELALHDPEHTTVEFKREQYRAAQHPELLRDLIALANAEADGERYLFVGIIPEAGDTPNEVIGIDPRELVDDSTYQQLVGENIEPALPVRYESFSINGKLVAVFRIGPCPDRPYLLRKAIVGHERGEGWIRRGSGKKRLEREDLERIYITRLERTSPTDVRVLFDSDPPSPTIELPVADLSDAPSAVEAEAIRAVLQQREEFRNRRNTMPGAFDALLGSIDHPLGGFALPGMSVPYSQRSTDELTNLLAKVTSTMSDDDTYYRLETKAHRLMMLVVNAGQLPLDSAVLELSFLLPNGVFVPERPVSPPYRYDPLSLSRWSVTPPNVTYPEVRARDRAVQVKSVVGNVLPGQTVPTFKQRLRCTCTELARGERFKIQARLLARNLRLPLQSELEIIVR